MSAQTPQPPKERPESLRPKPNSPREIRLEQAFDTYVAMGPARSFSKLSKEVGLPVTQIITHAKDFRWREELVEILSEASKRTRETLVESAAEINAKHVHELRGMREKALKGLSEKLDAGTTLHTRDLTKIYFESLKLERQATGIDEQKGKGNLVDMIAERLANVVSQGGGTTKHEFELDDDIDERLELTDDNDDDAGADAEPGPRESDG